MKAEDVKRGKVYQVKVGARKLILKVLNIKETLEKRDDGKKPRTRYIYECQDPDRLGKIHSVRTPSQFVAEVERKPKVGDIVRVFKGKHKDSLGAETVHRVKSVKGRDAIITSSSGGKEHRVRIDSIRVVDETADVFVSQTALEGEQRPDPTSDPIAPITGTGTRRDVPTASGSSLGYSPTSVSEMSPSVLAEVADDPTSGDEGQDAADRLCELAEGLLSDDEINDARTWADLARLINQRTLERDATAVTVPADPRLEQRRAVFTEKVVKPMVEDMVRGGIIPPTDSVTVSYTGDDPPATHTLRSKTPAFPGQEPSPQRSGLGARIAAMNANTDTAPHLIIEARAGTGKTTTLVEGLKPLLGMQPTIPPSEQQRVIWDAMALSKGKAKTFCFVAFNKSIAEELQKRVPHGACAMTMHSMGYSAVKSAFGKMKVESYRVANIVAEIAETDVRDLRSDPKMFALMRATEELVGLCKMNLTGFGVEEGILRTDADPADYWRRELNGLISHYEVEVPDDTLSTLYDLVPQVLKRCKDVRADMELDFNDMIWLPVVLGLKIVRYDVLVVDEAQDLNRCQQALAKMAGHRLILCGDAKQAIYAFCGADSDSLPRMYEELGGGVPLHSQARGCVKLPLTVTRRCGKKIVEEAKKLVPDFEALPDAHDGCVSRAKYPTERDKNLTAREKELNPDYSARVQDGDFVLCRCNAPLVSQCFRFLKQGRKATIQGRDIGKGLVALINKFKVSQVVDLVKCLSDWHHQEVKKENAKRNPSEAKLITLEDKYQCLLAFTEGASTTEQVIRKIESVFVDGDTSGIRFSSIHRAKGLEAKRVFLLMPESAPIPHYMAKSEWQIAQEWNLKYVAITRAIEELVYVT